MSLTLRPISIRDASVYVARWHRHLNPPRGALFALSAYDGGLEGAAFAWVGIRNLAKRWRSFPPTRDTE